MEFFFSRSHLHVRSLAFPATAILRRVGRVPLMYVVLYYSSTIAAATATAVTAAAAATSVPPVGQIPVISANAWRDKREEKSRVITKLTFDAETLFFLLIPLCVF